MNSVPVSYEVMGPEGNVIHILHKLIKYFSIPSFSIHDELLRIICKCATGTINGIITGKYLLCLHHYQTPLQAGTINWHLQQVRPSPRTRFITYLPCKQYPTKNINTLLQIHCRLLQIHDTH